jgi:formylglycine-generating enzyme required for sulfatase activity
VLYDGNGSSSGTVPVDKNRYVTGSTVTVPNNVGNLAKLGSRFVGWNALIDGTGTDFAPGATFSMGSGKAILHAKWEVAIEMVLVEGGTYVMGSLSGRSDEKPPHQVTLSSFLIGKYEITNEEYSQIMTGVYKYDSPRRPGGFNWYDAIEFCNKLSEKEGLNPVYSMTERTPPTGDNYYITSARVTIDMNQNGYRIPTEAEWEFAARGGNKSQSFVFSGSNTASEVASSYYFGDGNLPSYDVGQKRPNEFGICDMSGNYWEWCQDWYGNYVSGAQTDPLGPVSGSSRVVRSGGWGYSDTQLRVSARDKAYPNLRSIHGSGNNYAGLGLRIARSVF